MIVAEMFNLSTFHIIFMLRNADPYFVSMVPWHVNSLAEGSARKSRKYVTRLESTLRIGDGSAADWIRGAMVGPRQIFDEQSACQRSRNISPFSNLCHLSGLTSLNLNSVITADYEASIRQINSRSYTLKPST